MATAAAATAVERPGDAVARDLQFGYEAGHGEGIGEDEYVVEKSVDEYNKIGIVKSTSTMTRTVILPMRSQHLRHVLL